MQPLPLPAEAFLAGVLERFPNGSVNIFDRELRYLFAGGAGLATAGLSADTLIGKRLDELFTPESVEHVSRFYRQALNGETVRFQLPVFDRVYSIVAGPFGREGADIISIIAVAQDVTDAKRTEAALAESQARLQLALDVAGVSTWDLDVATGRVQRSDSVYHLLGLPETSPPTLHAFLDVVHPDDRERVASTIATAIETGERYATEFRVVLGDGAMRGVLVRGEPLLDENGRVDRLLGAMIDVTPQQELEEKLRDINRRKDDLLAILGHELRQPVHAAVAALGVMRARISRPAGERARQTIERQVTQMARLVDDLLEAGRIVKGEVQLRRRTVDLGESIRAALETVTAARQEVPDIDVRLPQGPVLASVDPDRIQQALVNLIGNAVKYTPPGGWIRIELVQGDGSLDVRITDSGAGIDPAHLPEIFELFTRGEQDRAGLGVGLAVVRRIVEQHGGRVSAHSEGKGTGASFVVQLPAS